MNADPDEDDPDGAPEEGEDSRAEDSAAGNGEDGAKGQRGQALGRHVLLGTLLLLMAWSVWTLRDIAPSWSATRFSACADLATTTEPDDRRVTRAFEIARQTVAGDSSLESLPNQTKVRHTRLTVRAPSSAAAVAGAEAMAEATAAVFSRDGDGTLSVNLRRRADPIVDSGGMRLTTAVRVGAGALALVGLAVIGLGWLKFRSVANRLPNEFWGIAGAFVLALGPPFARELLLPALILAVPLLVVGLVVWKTSEMRHVPHWAAGRARIVKSEPRAVRRSRSQAVSVVVSVPDVEYEFTVGGLVIRGTRISMAEIPEGGVERTLDSYRVGATVPVYYNPQNPKQALLDRNPPVAAARLYLVAGAASIVGLVALAAFENGAVIFEKVEPYFPPRAFVPGFAFFTLGGLMLLAMLHATRRQVTRAMVWPVTTGRVVSSTVESFRINVGRTGSGSVRTVYDAVVEYEYRVNGRKYHSTRLAFGGAVAGPEEQARDKAGRYMPGTEVAVRYDPANPASAVVDLEVAYGRAFFFIALVFFGLAAYFSGVFR
jgi:hypothetical protein